jgi:hypothetical protein
MTRISRIRFFTKKETKTGQALSRPTYPFYPRNPRLIPLGRERGDDFFETRIAPQRIPVGLETEVAVDYIARNLRESFALLNSEVGALI